MTIRRCLQALPLALVLVLIGRSSAQAPLVARDSARHALDRLGYGPVASQLDDVTRMGVANWIDRQLSITGVGDPALRERESRFGILSMSTRELVGLQADQLGRAIRAQAQGGDSAMRREMIAQAKGPNGRRTLRELNGELMTVTLVRDVHSERQLAEVLVDFWMNHFNVFVNKGFDRAYFRDHLERTIRPNVLGTFRDLLLASATSPAMLFYLDNVQSVADAAMVAPARRTPAGRPGAAGMAGQRGRPGVTPPGARPGGMPRGRDADPAMVAAIRQRMPRGLNENYARELLELHTLGVDGGYTQADVVGVARILTGWSIARGANGQAFVFNSRAHDEGEKVVLGVTYPRGGGENEGKRLLAMLADHPATMHHISIKLCARFVADAAPDGCVDDAVRTWKRTGGDLREVVRTIVRSPDFWAPANIASKVKTPLEFVVSAVRSVGGTVDDTPRLAQQVGQLGQPLFQQSAPTGYPETQADWVNSGALLARMNFAVALAANRLPGVSVDLDRLIPATADQQSLVTKVDIAVLHGSMSARTRETILREIADLRDPREARALAVGLAIGGPEFQRQ